MSLSILIIDMFMLCISPWFNFCRSYVPRNINSFLCFFFQFETQAYKISFCAPPNSIGVCCNTAIFISHLVSLCLLSILDDPSNSCWFCLSFKELTAFYFIDSLPFCFSFNHFNPDLYYLFIPWDLTWYCFPKTLKLTRQLFIEIFLT